MQFRQDGERADFPKGAYTGYVTEETRNRDKGLRRKCAQNQDLLRQVILPFVRS